MTDNKPELEGLRLILQMQQSEATIHWTRNNIFLVCSSILLLAFSQFDQLELRILVSTLGIILNLAWLLIQYRSSKYIQHWKTESLRLRATAEDMPDIFPSKDPRGKPRGIRSAASRPAAQALALVRDDA